MHAKPYYHFGTSNSLFTFPKTTSLLFSLSTMSSLHKGIIDEQARKKCRGITMLKTTKGLQLAHLFW